MQNDRELALEGIENAFKSDVGKLYANLVSNLATGGGGEGAMQISMDRFRKGLNLSKLALEKAREVVTE